MQEQPHTVEMVFVIGGNGLCNNRPCASASEFQVAAATQTSINNIANPAVQHKLSRSVDTSMSLVQNGICGTGGLMTVTGFRV